MAKFVFDSDALGRAFSIAKIVKPVVGDFTMKFVGDRLVMHSSDKRRYARAEVSAKSSSDVPEGFVSDEFYVPADRQTLLSSDLATTTLTVTDKGISVRAEGDGQVRNAQLKKRPDGSKRPPIPAVPDVSGATVMKASMVEDLLRQISCSAQIQQTKTEEDMKVNQVHFYGSDECALATSRFFCSVAEVRGMSLDLSIVASDIVALRTFCSKLGGSDVSIHQDRAHMYLTDPASGAVLCLSRIACSKPPFSILSPDGYASVVVADREKLVKAFQWAEMMVEGTQRITIAASGDQLILLNGQQEISRLPADMVRGDGIRADFPIRDRSSGWTFASAVNSLDGEKVSLKYGHRDLKTALEICDAAPPDEGVFARHFLQSMKER